MSARRRRDHRRTGRPRPALSARGEHSGPRAAPPSSAPGKAMVVERIGAASGSAASKSVAPVPVVFDFAQEPEPPAYLVDRLIERSTVNLLSGDTGAGKSIVVASLIVAVCSGAGQWLGREVYADRVICVDEENAERLVKARLRALGLCNEHADKLRYFSRQGFLIGSPEWTAALRSEARELGADLIVIDTAAAATNAEVNDNTEVAALYRALRSIATDLDLAIVLLHHERKPQPGQSRGDRGQATMGARQWSGQADSHIALRPHVALVETSDDGKRALRFELVMSTPKVRDGEADVPEVLSITSTKNQSGCLLTMSVTSAGRLEAEPSKQETAADAVAALLVERGELRRAEIAEALVYSVGTLDRALKRAMDDGLVMSPRRGSYAPATATPAPI
jgi:AAA domain